MKVKVGAGMRMCGVGEYMQCAGIGIRGLWCGGKGEVCRDELVKCNLHLATAVNFVGCHGDIMAVVLTS